MANLAAELTPANQGELQHVFGHEVVEDFDDGQVHMQSLQPHPGEGDQQEVVQEEGCGNAQTHSICVQRQPRVQQERQVEKEQGKTQMDQDLRRDVVADFSEIKQKKWVNKCYLGITDGSYVFCLR